MRVATDVGGTFTDLVAFEVKDQKIRQMLTAKSDTTPPDFENGVLNCLEKAQVDESAMDFFVHGCTVVINALTERKGCQVGLMTTAGFRDVLEIGRGNRPDYFNLRFKKNEPFVPRHLRHEVVGRITYKGEEQTPLDLSSLPQTLDYFRQEGVEAIAVCLLHSYANPVHEQTLAEAIKQHWSDIPVVISSDISREWREYERTSTAVLSAYVYPVANRYLDQLASAIAEKGFSGTPNIMQSNGGVDTVFSTKRLPINMVESGPSSGFLGAAALGNLIDEPNILALDIGGTTAKCSLIQNGSVTVNTDYYIEQSDKEIGYPMLVPVVDLVEIGNGGGSIAWVDDFGKMHVGPQSAGAKPGPAGYGKGGTEATTTDANLFLGRINPNYFCGGAFNADMEAVEKSLQKIGTKMNMTPQEVAQGILRIANHNMTNALKLVSQNRGHDPRDFTLLCFGGGGAMHATDLAQELNIKRVVIPIHSAVFSAWGMLMSDLRRDYVQTHLMDLTSDCFSILETDLTEIENTARQSYLQENFSEKDLYYQRMLRLRYQGQEHSVKIPVTQTIQSSDDLQKLAEQFHQTHEQEYTYRLNAPVEVVGYHVAAFARVDKPTPALKAKTGLNVADLSKESRKVDYLLDGIHTAQIIDGNRLEPDMVIEGPAVIEEQGTTIVIGLNQVATVDQYGSIVIEMQ